MKKIFIISSILSLFCGTIIYLLFRTPSLKIFTWFNNLNLDILNSKIRIKAFAYSEFLPLWILFSLPDGLWTFSYVCLMLYIWNLKINIQSVLWIILIPGIAIVSEIGQAFDLIQGTFDFLDLFFYLLGLVLPLVYIYIKSAKTIYYDKK